MREHGGAAGESGAPGEHGRLSEIPTRWSVVQGPRRDALDHLYRVYWIPLRRYVAGCIRRGGFEPLREEDAEDLLADFFLFLGKSEWLEKPDRSKGRFHVFLKRRISWYLMDRRKGARLRATWIQDLAGAEPVDPASTDGLDARFEKEWVAATVRECLDRLRAHQPAQAAVLTADLEEEQVDDSVLARRLGRSVDAVRGLRRRGEAEFRRIFEALERRLEGEA